MPGPRRFPLRSPAAAALVGIAALALALASGRTSARPAPDSRPDRRVVATPDEAPRQDGRIRGITISTHGIGFDWADESTMRRTFEDLASIGANWVTIHPYAGISRDGGVGTGRRRRHREAFGDGDGMAHVETPIRLAHEVGLKIMIKPHLAYWGSGFAWRGEIQFGDDGAAWDRFFEQYRAWIVDVARHSAGADGFAVGTELDATLQHADEWRRTIAAVRDAYDGPLTYAANWTDFERVPFWQELDAIGIQGYFPLTEQPAADTAAIRAGWRGLRERLRAYSVDQGRPVVLTELGYNRSDQAPVQPWDYGVGGQDAEGTQQRCLAVALEEIEQEPAIIGAFLWKWFPEPRPVGRTFQLATPRLRQVIRERWHSTGG